MTMKDFEKVEQAIGFLDGNFRSQPSLGEIAEHVGLSEYHFQRLFRRWAGVSPKRFLQYLTAEYARKLLEASRSVLDTAYDAGLSGMGRLHDLMVSIHAMTPGEIGGRGAGLIVRYGYHPSPFGECLVARTDRGICGLAFVPEEGRERPLRELEQRWKGAVLREDPEAAGEAARRIFAPPKGARGLRETLYVQGTNFQIKVWEALLRIPPGAAATYGDIARAVGAPGASRAVGTAVSLNPVAYLIPCHRVIRKTGAFGGYRWGAARKAAMLGLEAARAHAMPGKERFDASRAAETHPGSRGFP